MAKYKLRCLYPGCNREYEGYPRFRLRCDGEINGEHGSALLQTVYEAKQISVRTDLPGIFPYVDWLPVGFNYINPSDYTLGRPYSYKSEGLARQLGLKNLHIAFSGYWPEKGAHLLTRAFKELECQASIVNYLNIFSDEQPSAFLVSSAGNTANGFNLISHILNLPLYLVVPEQGLCKIQLPLRTEPFVVVVKGDYSDAIELADKLAAATGLTRDGGVRNVACRAGMGIVFMNAVAHPEQGTQQLFDHYFQAVGSGAGAIAAWEAVQLLRGDGRFGNTRTKIHVAQNIPYTPIPQSWRTGRRDVVRVPDELTKERIRSVTADVLTTRNPAYSIAGGIFDVLTASNGHAWEVSNSQLFDAARLFRESEGTDISPPAAVAVDALRQAVLAGKVQKHERIILHITGGGKEAQYDNRGVYQVQPTIVVKPGELEPVIKKMGEPRRIINHRQILKRYEDPDRPEPKKGERLLRDMVFVLDKPDLDRPEPKKEEPAVPLRRRNEKNERTGS